MKPRIGIFCPERTDRGVRYAALREEYVHALLSAGTQPILLPLHESSIDVLSEMDGWLIPGGADPSGAHFGEPDHPQARVEEPTRFPLERKALERMSPLFPILGICYGCQCLNIAAGGTLIQHLPDVVGHDRDASGDVQVYRLAPGSRLAGALLAEAVEGPSFHHQAVGRLGEGYQAVAWNEDGQIEAIEAASSPWRVGVQWHPERLLENPASQRLFGAFAEAARDYAISARRAS